MGTSLSGLTPATTFDGLLKVGDNDPLTSQLKAISTGDGTDTILQLSDSALSIGGNTSIGSSDNTSGSNALVVQNSDGTQLFAVRNDGRLLLGTDSNIMYLDGALLRAWQINNSYLNAQKVGIGVDASGNYPLHIKGSGTTSATTSLLVRNSAGTDMLKVQDDGRIDLSSGNLYLNNYTFFNGAASLAIENDMVYRGFGSHRFTTYNGTGGYPEVMRITGNTAEQKVGIGETTPTARLHIKGSGNDNTTNALLVQNSDGTELLKVTDDGIINARQAFFVNHLTNSLRSLRLGWGSLHATDNASELNIGAVYSEPTAPKIVLSGKTRASGADAIQVQTLNGMYIAPTANTEDPSAQLHIKGSGNDNTTTALLVQNSDGANLFKVDDSGIGVLVNDDQAGFIRLSASGEYGNIGGGRILRITSGGANPLMISGSGSNGVVIGSTSATTLAANTALAVKGQGATSATNALLVENSAGTEAFKVRDDGNIYLSYSTDAQVLFPKYAMDKTRLHPLTGQNLGVDTNTNFQFGSAFFNDKIHITDNVASNTTADASAKLQVDSTTQGFLPPRMTDSERDAITTPAPGLMVYDTSNNQMNYWNGTTWIAF